MIYSGGATGGHGAFSPTQKKKFLPPACPPQKIKYVKLAQI